MHQENSASDEQSKQSIQIKREMLNQFFNKQKTKSSKQTILPKVDKTPNTNLLTIKETNIPSNIETNIVAKQENTAATQENIVATQENTESIEEINLASNFRGFIRDLVDSEQKKKNLLVKYSEKKCHDETGKLKKKIIKAAMLYWQVHADRLLDIRIKITHFFIILEAIGNINAIIEANKSSFSTGSAKNELNNYYAGIGYPNLGTLICKAKHSIQIAGILKTLAEFANQDIQKFKSIIGKIETPKKGGVVKIVNFIQDSLNSWVKTLKDQTLYNQIKNNYDQIKKLEPIEIPSKEENTLLVKKNSLLKFFAKPKFEFPTLTEEILKKPLESKHIILIKYYYDTELLNYITLKKYETKNSKYLVNNKQKAQEKVEAIEAIHEAILSILEDKNSVITLKDVFQLTFNLLEKNYNWEQKNGKLLIEQFNKMDLNNIIKDITSQRTDISKSSIQPDEILKKYIAKQSEVYILLKEIITQLCNIHSTLAAAHQPAPSTNEEVHAQEILQPQ